MKPVSAGRSAPACMDSGNPPHGFLEFAGSWPHLLRHGTACCAFEHSARAPAPSRCRQSRSRPVPDCRPAIENHYANILWIGNCFCIAGEITLSWPGRTFTAFSAEPCQPNKAKKHPYHHPEGGQVNTTELLQTGFEIGERWQIVDTSYDSIRRQFDVHVTESAGRGWFARQKSVASANEKHVWRHVNVGTRRCFVHLAVTPGQLPADQPWSGERDIPFTHALSRQIAALLMHGVNLQAICSVLDISLTDLWKLKYSLDSGKTGLSSMLAPSQAPAAAVSTSGVPDTSDPIWERLLDGSVNIDISFLSLKLLLTKLREQMRIINDDDVRMLKIYEIQRYFERNEPRLKHELTQLAKVGKQ